MCAPRQPAKAPAERAIAPCAPRGRPAVVRLVERGPELATARSPTRPSRLRSPERGQLRDRLLRDRCHLPPPPYSLSPHSPARAPRFLTIPSKLFNSYDVQSVGAALSVVVTGFRGLSYVRVT